MYIFLFLAIPMANCILALQSSAMAYQHKTRIVGGNIADIGRHPYLVSIRIGTSSTIGYLHMCAGVIYNERTIITAAQCFSTLGADDRRLMVVAGANTRNGSDGMQMPVAKTIAHPNYNYWTIDNDVGIVILDEALRYNNFNVKPIRLRARRRPIAATMATVAGWGYKVENGPPSYFLEEAQVPIVSNSDCEKIYGNGEITGRMVCAGFKQGGKDGCQGDTGGPLVIDGELVGLVSWGRGCARAGYPGVYTYVPSLKNWIDNTIAGNII